MKTTAPKVRAADPPTFAVGLDGTVYVDLRGLSDDGDVVSALAGIGAGERCFIGVALGRRDRSRLRRQLDAAAVECAAYVLGARGRRT
jgi:hypothetical protein